MGKDKSEINMNPRPMFYVVALEKLRKIAIDCGYALAVHGSCAKDMDLIAVRWTENYESPKYLTERFLEELSHFYFGEDDGTKEDFAQLTNPEVRFGSHYHFTIPIYANWYIDLCVII